MKKERKRKRNKQKTKERIERGCGVDIDKDNLWCCAYTAKGRKVHYYEEKFRNSPPGIESMRIWLAKHNILAVACESTGVYWIPMYDALYQQFEVIVGNSAHMARMAGYKTDRSDGEWIANLLLNRAIQPSFVPPPPQRTLRKATRRYRTLVQDQNRVQNRICGLFREAGITTDSVISSWFIKSGQWMIQEIVAGKPPAQVVEVIHYSLKPKKEEILESLQALPLSPQFHDDLRDLWDHYLFLAEKIERKWAQAEAAAKPFQQSIEKLLDLEGIGAVTAITAIAEFGDDMSRFPSAKHLASWAGLCPGNNESGGKRKSGKTRKGNKWLRLVMVQAAHSSLKPFDSPFRDYFNSLKGRIGYTKAIVALAHKLLRIMHAILRSDNRYSAELTRVRRQRSWRVRKHLRTASDPEMLGEVERRPGLIEAILANHVPSV